MKILNKFKQKGFSIIEMMVAITISLIIGALVANYVMQYLEESRISQAQAKIALLTADLDSYWRFNQTFAGYNTTAVTVPNDDSIVRYNISIYDKDTGGLLTESSSIGKHYAIIATPSVENKLTLYINDQGEKCSNMIANQVTVNGCGKSGQTNW